MSNFGPSVFFRRALLWLAVLTVLSAVWVGRGMWDE